MKRALPIFFAGVLLSLALASARGDEAAPPAPAVAKATDEELAVYKALFAGKEMVVIFKLKMSAGEGHPAGRDDEERAYYRHLYPALEDATFADYVRRRDEDAPLTAESDVGVKLAILDQKAYDEIFQVKSQHPGVDWNMVVQRYGPHEVIAVSRVGFNAAKTQAMVYFSNEGPRDTPTTGTWVLIKRDGKWVVVRNDVESIVD